MNIQDIAAITNILLRITELFGGKFRNRLESTEGKVGTLEDKQCSDLDFYEEFCYPFRRSLLDCKLRIDELDRKIWEYNEVEKFYKLLEIVLEEVIPVIEERGQYISDIELRKEILTLEEETKELSIDSDENSDMIGQISEDLYKDYIKSINKLYASVDDFVKKY